MLNERIKSKLESLVELPTIPSVLSEVLESVDNLDLSAKKLALIIEKDQSLTARILRVANSPFYGFSRTISTIDLAIIVLGLNSIKEIVLSMVLKKFFTNISKKLFDVNSFWHYSVYCGAASKFLSKKLDYRISGEAFVAGLMHDVGILILIHFFKNDFIKIREYQNKKKCSLLNAELEVLQTHHGEIGSWIAEEWQLPEQLCNAINNHHNKYDIDISELNENNKVINEPLTFIVSVAEWFASKANLKSWSDEKVDSQLYIDENMIDNYFFDASLLNHESKIEKMKLEIEIEFEKALESHSIS